jgi:hypothetical protein
MRRREILTGAAALAIAAGLPRAADAQAFVGAKRALLGAVPSWVLHGAKIDLDLANNRPYGGTLASLLSVSRASTGYATDSAGNLVAFGVNTLRRTDLGLLIEEARTNLQRQSQTMDNAGWVKSGLFVTADATNAPDGTLTADKMVELGAGVTHGMFGQSNTIVAGQTFTASFFAKAAGRSQFFVMCEADSSNGPAVAIDLSTGTITATGVGSGTTGGAYASSTITALANGWYRCTITGTVKSDQTTAYIHPILLNAAVTGTLNGIPAAATYTGDGTSGIYFWGAQIEANTSFATSYIPTTNAAATRALDNITALNALLNLLNLPGNIGPVSVFVQTYQMLHASSNTAIVGSGGSRQLLALNSNTGLSMSEYNGSVNLGANLGSGNFQTGVAKTAVAWDAAGRSIVANNGTVATDSGSVGSATGAANIGSYGSTTAINGYLQRMTVWNKRLSDAALKALTA